MVCVHHRSLIATYIRRWLEACGGGSVYYFILEIFMKTLNVMVSVDQDVELKAIFKDAEGNAFTSSDTQVIWTVDPVFFTGVISDDSLSFTISPVGQLGYSAVSASLKGLTCTYLVQIVHGKMAELELTATVLETSRDEDALAANIAATTLVEVTEPQPLVEEEVPPIDVEYNAKVLTGTLITSSEEEGVTWAFNRPPNPETPAVEKAPMTDLEYVAEVKAGTLISLTDDDGTVWTPSIETEYTPPTESVVVDAAGVTWTKQVSSETEETVLPDTQAEVQPAEAAILPVPESIMFDHDAGEFIGEDANGNLLFSIDNLTWVPQVTEAVAATEPPPPEAVTETPALEVAVDATLAEQATAAEVVLPVEANDYVVAADPTAQ